MLYLGTFLNKMAVCTLFKQKLSKLFSVKTVTKCLLILPYVFGKCCDPVVGTSPPASTVGEGILGVDWRSWYLSCSCHLSCFSACYIVCVIQRTGQLHCVHC